MSDDHMSIVIDAGSQNLKAGFAGEHTPRVMFPTTVGRFRHPGLDDGIPLVYCGREAVENRGTSNLVWPIQDGVIKDWEEMEKLWYHTFYKELFVPPENSKVMYAVHPLMSIEDKERMTEILFETFSIQGLYLAKHPTLVLHASGRTTGIVWENGYACSYVAPVFEGFHLKHSTVVSPLTGKVLTERLQKLLLNTGYTFTTPREWDILDYIKKELCYVPLEYEEELKAIEPIKYKLSDGQVIELGAERFQVPELLFQPQLGGYNCKNLVESIQAGIDLTDIDYRKMFFKNIVFSGGSSMFSGLKSRAVMELSRHAKSGFKPKIEDLSLKQFAAWTGGSLVASLSILNGFWFTKQDYEEAGSTRVRYKFF